MDEHNTLANSQRDENAIDHEAVGIDRPGLHAVTAGERPHNEAFTEVLARNIERRSFLMGAAAAVPVLMMDGGLTMRSAEAAAIDGLAFKPIKPSKKDDVVVPSGYEHDVLLRWGDPLFSNAPNFNPNQQTAAAQRRQFGYNCDFVGYFALSNNDRALLAVNHEYTTGGDMFRKYEPGENKVQADVEIAAHGGSVVEIVRQGNSWRYLKTSKYNRRITGDTPMTITGPAAGHPLMRTSADRTGRSVLGMLNNCAGGKTPWGTWLTCEENFNQYFANNANVADEKIKAVHRATA